MRIEKKEERKRQKTAGVELILMSFSLPCARRGRKETEKEEGEKRRGGGKKGGEGRNTAPHTRRRLQKIINNLIGLSTCLNLRLTGEGRVRKKKKRK